jgi:hypothetical protein
MDYSYIFSNAWLAGFIDADGNFSVIIAPRKNTNNIRIQNIFRIELRQNYHRITNISTSYFDVMSIIATNLGVNVYNRARFFNNSMTYQYYFVAGTKKSQNIIINYLNNFSLFSSKYLDFIDWCKIIELNLQIKNINKNDKEIIINSANKLKSGMNSKRTIFSWEHLKNL